MFNQRWNKIYRNAEGGAAGGTTPAAAAPASAPPAAPPAVWTDSLQDAELRDFAVNKGYNKGAVHEVVPTILTQYRHLEKLVGAEKAGNTVIIPNFDADDEVGVKSQGEFYDRIGRPKESKDYDLGVPQGATINEKMEKWSRENFHKVGLTAKQATALSKAYQEMEAADAYEKQQADVQRFADEDKALKQEWGAAYQDKIDKASAVAKGLGIDGKVIDTLQSQAGYSNVMKMFSMLAEKVGEDKLVTSDDKGGGTKLTPAEADAELRRLNNDKDWLAAWMDKNHPNHKAAVERKSFLTSQLAAAQ